MTVELDPADRALLDGSRGAGVALAMRVLVRVADVLGAEHLLDIEGAHIDSCLFHGRSGIDFVERLATDDARVVVPTTLNVSSLDLLHPELYRGDAETAALSRRLMEGYEQLGCEPTWTCAPYERRQRPGFGDHVAWAESNAIVFANSVLGARTHRYGDFIDICAALTGRAPAAGFHLDEARAGTVVYEVDGLAPELASSDVLAPVLGYLIGADCGAGVPVIDGLPAGQPEHRLKALGAAAASSGSVGMFHCVGTTPEAPDRETALQHRPAERIERVGPARLASVRSLFAPEPGTAVGGVCLGTPHYGIAEFQRLVALLGGRSLAAGVRMYVNTGREILHEFQLRGWAATLEAAGVQIVTDTCTYITPVTEPMDGVVLTDSAKWAHYAPGNIGVEASLVAIDDCVESAVTGVVVDATSSWWSP